MADRFPLILNTNANQIQEIASGDTLDLTGTNIKGVGIITATNLSGNITAGAGTSSVVAGVGTFTDLRVGGNTTFSEDLVVTGNARVTGILTVGTSSIILNDSANTIKVGTALTLGHTQGLQFHTQNLHSLGFEVNQINASGIITATQFKGDGSGLTGISNASIAGGAAIALSKLATGLLPAGITVGGSNIVAGSIYNSDVNASAAISGSKIAAQFDGQDITGRNINLTHGTPTLGLISNSANPDFMIQNQSGKLIFQDTTNTVNRLVINTDGHIDVAGNLDVGAGVDVTGNVIASGNVSGVNGVFSGNVSVGGVLTYEDVTNVDSVGIITARTSIKAINASANAGNYLEIKTNADSSSDIIKAGAGAFFIKGHNIYIGDDDSNKVYMGGEKDGKSFLKFNNSTKIETTNTGVVATGIMTATSFSGGGLKLKDDGADSPILSVMTDDGSPWAFQIGNSTYHDSMSTGTMIYISDGGVGYFNHRGNGAYKQFEFALNNGSAAHRCIVFEPSDQSVELYCANNKKLETHSGGVNVTGSIAAGKLTLTDDGASNPVLLVKSDDEGPWGIIVGNSTYSSNSRGLKFLQANSGNCQVRVSGEGSYVSLNFLQDNATTSRNLLTLDANGSVVLRHQGNIKFNTTSSGCDLQGTLTAQNTGYGSGSSNIEIQPYGQRGYINWTGTENFYFRTGSSYTTRWIIDSNGHFKPGANDTYDLGSTGLRWRNIYTNDLNLSNKGSTNSVDNTWGDYTIQEGESDLFLINNRSGKKYKFNLTEVS